jgi:nicotinate-nucleotide--dimethylbenzimidazole phosphoribosyltransferase
LLAGTVYLVEGDALADVLRTGWTGIPSDGMSALAHLQYEHAGALSGVLAIGMVATSALFAGAASAAYRAVVLGEAAPERVSTPEIAPVMAPAWSGAVALAAATPVEAPRQPAEPEPAWAAAKAIADAGRPQWRHDPFAQPLPAAPAAEEHALASEAAATTLAEQPEIVPEHAAADELVLEPEPVFEAAAAPAEAPQPEPAAQAEQPALATLSKQELIMAQLVHAAFAQMPGHMGEAGAETPAATFENIAAPALSDTPPLDPAGMAAHEAAKEPAE